MHFKIWGFIFFIISSIVLSNCIRIDNSFTKIPPGPWRAILRLDPSTITPNPKGQPLEEKLNLTFDEVANGELPFNFDVIYTDDTTFHIEFINGSERIKSEHISFGHTKSRVKDSIRIDFPVYDTYITGMYEDGLIEGDWVVNYRTEYRIPFIAHFGKNHRFTKMRKEPGMDISGKWAVTFSPNDDPYPAIGEFVQEGNELTGTFRTETGDYRFLQGTVQGNKAYLSVFDGSHAFLFEALIDTSTQSMLGSFRSGKHYKTTWQAKKNDDAQLTNPDSLTYLIDGNDELAFNFTDLDGNIHSLDDPSFNGKVKVVQIMGTWCPNCRDETEFLLEYLKENPSKDLEVIGIGFERYREEEKSIAVLKRFKETLDIPYLLLYGGYYSKKEAVKSMPMLNHILSYPTLIIVDKNNKVRKIHTGFEGPATKEYQGFKENFSRTIEQLIAE